MKLTTYTIALKTLGPTKVGRTVTYVDPNKTFSQECTVISVSTTEAILEPKGPKHVIPHAKPPIAYREGNTGRKARRD